MLSKAENAEYAFDILNKRMRSDGMFSNCVEGICCIVLELAHVLVTFRWSALLESGADTTATD